MGGTAIHLDMTLTEFKTNSKLREDSETTFTNTLNGIAKTTEEEYLNWFSSTYLEKTCKERNSGQSILSFADDFVVAFTSCYRRQQRLPFFKQKASSFMQEYNKDPSDTSLRAT